MTLSFYVFVTSHNVIYSNISDRVCPSWGWCTLSHRGGLERGDPREGWHLETWGAKILCKLTVLVVLCCIILFVHLSITVHVVEIFIWRESYIGDTWNVSGNISQNILHVNEFIILHALSFIYGIDVMYCDIHVTLEVVCTSVWRSWLRHAQLRLLPLRPFHSTRV